MHFLVLYSKLAGLQNSKQRKKHGMPACCKLRPVTLAEQWQAERRKSQTRNRRCPRGSGRRAAISGASSAGLQLQLRALRRCASQLTAYTRSCLSASKQSAFFVRCCTEFGCLSLRRASRTVQPATKARRRLVALPRQSLQTQAPQRLSQRSGTAASPCCCTAEQGSSVSASTAAVAPRPQRQSPPSGRGWRWSLERLR
jgi:hypothetical protein